MQKNLLKISAKAKILTIKKTISRSIQKNARDHRYKIMSDFCKKNKISYMLTAHHLDDQIENFYIRLSRGSGLQGLSSMKIAEKNKIKFFKKKNINDIKFINYIKKNNINLLSSMSFDQIFKNEIINALNKIS